MFSWVENQQHYSTLYRALARNASALRLEAGVIIVTFLKAARILLADAFDPDFISSIMNGSRNLSREHRKDKIGLRGVFMLALLVHVDKLNNPGMKGRAKLGLPGNLLEYGTDMCGFLFRLYYAERWKHINSLFGRTQWFPFGIRRSIPVPKRWKTSE
jgi:hypothetical protein